jgi:hypothetical protein
MSNQFNADIPEAMMPISKIVHSKNSMARPGKASFK